MDIETKVLDVETHGSAPKEMVRRIKSVARLEKARVEARNGEIIDMIIKGSGRKQQVITMRRANNGCFLEIDGKPKVYAESISACAARSLELKYYNRSDYNRIINKKVV